jgi:hypothetical protein
MAYAGDECPQPDRSDFNTFQDLLKRDAAYSNLISNRGTVLELPGRHDEARQHFDDATEFQP